VLLQVQFSSMPSYADDGEFHELAVSADLDPVCTITASRDKPHQRWFVGSGKVDEIKSTLAASEADLLLVAHELGASQQRNLEEKLGARVMTRTELILHIFADRAQTHEGKLQVELAQLQHAQTRVVRGWTHLDRQKGGIGLRGAGEKQIEMDHRMIAGRIKSVKGKLLRVAKRRQQGRRMRKRAGTHSVILVGYTNAGKSTLFNRLTDAQVLAQDRLFATLDPTMRRLPLEGVGEVVLGDTVGFIRDLPHDLIEAFKATLEEVAQADLLLHVIDAADPMADEQVEQVNLVLKEIGAEQVPMIKVFNKADLLPRQSQQIPDEENHPVSKNEIWVSAVDGTGIEGLLKLVSKKVSGEQTTKTVILEPGAAKTRAWLYGEGAVIGEKIGEDGSFALTLRGGERLYQQLENNGVVAP